jgi:hypothetical protein
MKGQYREDVCDVCDGLGYLFLEDVDDEYVEDVECPECRGRGRKAYYEAKEKGE